MKVMVIPIVICELGTTPKGLVRELEELKIRGRKETIQMTGLLTSARIQRSIPETCCHSNSSENPSANAGLKNSQRIKILMINKPPDNLGSYQIICQK